MDVFNPNLSTFMVNCSQQLQGWVDFEGNVSSMSSSSDNKKSVSDMNLGFGERAFSAAGAAAISAVLVNPLDIAKVEQYAYMLYNHFLLFSAIFLIDRYGYNGMGRENFNLRKKPPTKMLYNHLRILYLW